MSNEKTRINQSRLKLTREFPNKELELTHKSYTPVCECGGELKVFETDTDLRRAQLTMRCTKKECSIITHIWADIKRLENE